MEPAHARRFVLLGLLWLAGNCLRLTILAVPPVLPSIHRDLHLSESMVGALTSLPVVLLAVGAIPGSLLVSRLGPRRALILGLLVVALGGAGRGVGGSAPLLFTMTLVMGAGIAVSQPSLPSLVRKWAPDRPAIATAVYSNGLLVGEILAAALTIPLVLPLVGGRWQLVFAFWSLPVLLAAGAIAICTSRDGRQPGASLPSWWPDWRSATTWRLGLILGCASTTYFGSNAFIPDYLRTTHHRELIALALATLNLSQLPASFLVGFLAERLVGHRWPIAVSGTVTALTAVFLLGLGGLWVVVGAGLLGFSSALILVLSLALPPLLAGEGDVHRLSAAMFTITYTCSFAGSLLGGVLWDLSGIPTAAFFPVAAAGVLMVLLVSGLDLRSSIAG